MADTHTPTGFTGPAVQYHVDGSVTIERAPAPTPKYPPGSAEYAAYCSNPQIELGKFARREPPYDYDEFETPLSPTEQRNIWGPR